MADTLATTWPSPSVSSSALQHSIVPALAGILLFAAPAAARPPAPGTEDYTLMLEFKDWIVTQHASNGQWCCDLGDGRPLHDYEVRFVPGDATPRIEGDRASVAQNGHYQILYTRRHWDDGTEEWIDVPASALLRTTNPLGLAVAWVIHGRVFCLSLPGAV